MMKRKIPLAVALMHYPTIDRHGDLVATNITHFDIHDIARACRVYGVDRYIIVHPAVPQQMFVERVLDHWRTGDGSKFNPMRKTALTDVYVADNLNKGLSAWGYPQAQVVATHARALPGQAQFGFDQFRTLLTTEDIDSQGYVLIFGTGFGLTTDFMKNCSAVLDPLRGDSSDDYRHLSVRSAVSICLDRLLGQ